MAARPQQDQARSTRWCQSAALCALLLLLVGRPGVAAEIPAGTDPDDLVKLGTTMLDSREYAAAVETLDTAVAAIEAEQGIFDPRLVAPLRGLGRAFHHQGRFEEAAGAFDRAIHLVRVNDGLHSVEQAELIDELTDTLVALGRWQEANDRQEYAMFVQQRHHGVDSPALVPGLYRFARWYRRVGDVLEARKQYELAVDILESDRGPGDLSLVPALQGLAVTYRMERYPTRLASEPRESAFRVSGPNSPLSPADDIRHAQAAKVNRFGPGEAALRRAVGILANHPETNPVQRAEALVELGDWYLLFEKWSRAMTAYTEAQKMLFPGDNDPVGHPAAVERLFGEPVPLHFPVPARPPAPLSRSARPVSGYVDLEYDVDPRGMVREVRVLASEPEGLMDFKSRRSLRAARYRPRFVNGVPVPTVNMAYRYNFTWFREGPPG